jgi:hypothetical protein
MAKASPFQGRRTVQGHQRELPHNAETALTASVRVGVVRALAMEGSRDGYEKQPKIRWQSESANMTAEIAILNKNAVALAADSAVTLRNPDNQKVYNTANKLFMLSKYHPVGIMVYGSADLIGVPWETVIKMFRAELHTTNFDRLIQLLNTSSTFLKVTGSYFLRPSKKQNSLECVSGFSPKSRRRSI